MILHLSELATHNLTLETLPIKKFHKPYEESVKNVESTNNTLTNCNVSEWLHLEGGDFPTRIISKTDELNIQSYSRYFDDMKQHDIYCTLKLDGSSMTLIYNKVPGKFMVCSRNLKLAQSDNEMVKFAIKMISSLDLKNKLDSLFDSETVVCIQGEFVGPKINGNKLQLSETDFFVFSIKVIDPSTNGYFYNFYQLIDFVKQTGLKMVPVLYPDLTDLESVESLKDFTNKLYYDQDELKQRFDKTFPNPNPAEGIVIRPRDIVSLDNFPQSFLSLKIINDNYKTDVKLLRQEKNAKKANTKNATLNS